MFTGCYTFLGPLTLLHSIVFLPVFVLLKLILLLLFALLFIGFRIEGRKQSIKASKLITPKKVRLVCHDETKVT